MRGRREHFSKSTTARQGLGTGVARRCLQALPASGVL